MAARTQPSVPYNPQQWSRATPVSGQHVQHAQHAQHAQTSVPARLHDVTGMEGAACRSSPGA